MRSSRSDSPTALPRGGTLTALAALALAVIVALLAASAGAAEPQEELDQKEAQLGKVRERQGVLTSELEEMSDEISRLEGAVSRLRSQEVEVEAELAAKQAELDEAQGELDRALDRLAVVRGQLKRALTVLRERLVAIYEAGSPDLVDVVLTAEDWSEAASQTEYLNRISEQDEAIAGRVRDLRDQAQAVVIRQRELRDQIAAARDAIAAREAELESTRANLEAQRGDLVSARGARKSTLDELSEREEVLEGDVSELQAEIQATLGTLPGVTGPVPSGSGTFTWPVTGTLTSGFGYRWGRQHEGIDIAAAEGTPIWAAGDGTVVVQQGEYESGGYGNYTCIEHGNGLATCYAHQSSFAVSLGEQVAQGEVIGSVGNTGHSFGAHLHFEVRVGGVAQDPLGYL
jgi:murein DD-endopeptidase MepM/ murein hydrolase activator NlpD